MQNSWAAVLALVLAAGGPAEALSRQQVGPAEYTAVSGDEDPVADFRINVRVASTGELTGSRSSTQAGQFSFSSLQTGSYVIEIVDPGGKVVGLSSSIDVTEGATVTVSVGPGAAAEIMAGNGGRLARLDLGPVASVAVASPASPAAVTAVAPTRGGKIVVCHRFSATAATTLEINDRARELHLGHGDTLGACPTGVTR